MSEGSRPLPPRTLYLAATLAVFLILCLAVAICLFASPRPPAMNLPRVPVSDAAADSGEDKIQRILDAPLGPFTVELTEEEATSLLALRLPGSPFLNPQIHMRGGYVYISGVVNMGVPLSVVSMWTVVRENERPRVVLERASIGPFSLAPLLLRSVSSTINEMIDESGTGIMPSAVQIGDGRIIIEGVKSPPTIP